MNSTARRIAAAVSWTALGGCTALVALAMAQTPAPMAAPTPVAVAAETPWAAIAQIVATIIGALVTGFLAYLARGDARDAKQEATKSKEESAGAKMAAGAAQAEAERGQKTADTISERVDEYHKSVNSKMDALLKATDEAAELRGVLKERERQALVLAATAAQLLKEKGAVDAAAVLEGARLALIKEEIRVADADRAAHTPPIAGGPKVP